MIIYLIYSTISLGLLLLFYHLILEKEKMHSINRGFLIFSLIFSFTIPIIPVGMIDFPTNAFSFLDFLTSEKSENIVIQGGEWYELDTESALASNQGSQTGRINFPMAAWLIYMIVSSGMFIRLIRIVHRIQLKTDRSDKRLFNGTVIVLLSEDTTPHTFLNKIFLNKRRYLNGEIPQEVILHEVTHARQKHSLDILLVEFLKILFWFNPLIYLYKNAILLNHEFLADEAVLKQGNSVNNYQKVLLKSLLLQPSHGLSSRLNYSLTKKRLQMMTKSKSTYRSVLKLLVAIPLIVTISLLPGCDSTSHNLSPDIEASDELRIEILEDSSLMVNSSRTTLPELDKYLSELPEPPRLVHLKVDPEAQFGIITDVQKLLRKSDALRINYSTNRDDQKSKLEKVTDAFLDSAKRYMAIEPIQSNMTELEEMYEEVSELYEAIQEVEVEITDPNEPTPPPRPPLVPSPEKRLSAKTLALPEAPPAPPVPVEPENLMQIMMNEQGLVMMNDEPVTLDEVRDSVKRFVNSSGADPSQVIIAIKTVRKTPFDQYLVLLDEIKLAYAELKNEAAQDQFGASYLSFEEYSSERTRIDDEYLMRLSIIPPDQQ